MSTSEDSSSDMLAQLRVLSHRLSNSLEVIMQAQYLLQRSSREPLHPHLKENAQAQTARTGHSPEKEEPHEAGKWTTMIGNAAEEAAQANREIRDTVRRLSALEAAEASPSLSFAPKRNKKGAGPLG